MTSFSMTSFHVDLNKAAKCVDMLLALLASLSRPVTLPAYENWSWGQMKVGDVTTWKELTIGIQQLVKLLFDNNFIYPARPRTGPRTCPLNKLV